MIEPLVGATTGTVLAVSAVESGSTSPASVRSPLTGVSSFVEIVSLSKTGASFTGVTVINIVSFLQLSGAGVPPSQIFTITKSVPLKLRFGVYVYVPSAFTMIEPLVGARTGTVLAVSAVVSGSKSPASVRSPFTGVSSFVEIISLSKTGGSLNGATVMNIVSFTQIAGIGFPASQILIMAISGPL